jgi:hypothetical protein
VDTDKQKALSEFYREEFVRHLDHLQCNGAVGSATRAAVDRACRKILRELDEVCCRDEFPAVAETLLQNFDTLTRLSEIQPRQGH